MNPHRVLLAARLSAHGITSRRPGCFFPHPHGRPARRTTLVTISSPSSSPSSSYPTGQITAADDESIVFIDNLFPLRLAPVLEAISSSLTAKAEKWSLTLLDPSGLVQRAFPSPLLSSSSSVNVARVVPHLKDGGIYLTIRRPPALTAHEVEQRLQETLRQHPVRPWLSPLATIQAGLVHGVPWLEDLYRFPNRRLKVEFVADQPDQDAAAELSEESLYVLFRRYGKLATITPQPYDSKALPHFAYLDFTRTRDAIMARNCLHRYLLPPNPGSAGKPTQLRLSYEPYVRARHIWSGIKGHARFVFPLLATVLAAITVSVFDPIRQWFVEAQIAQSFQLSHSQLYSWFSRRASDFLPGDTVHAHLDTTMRGRGGGGGAIWTQRQNLVDSIHQGLVDTAETFIVVHGPRGSGKSELVLNQALRGRRNVLVIDCKPIVEARGESGLLARLARTVGYRPFFAWTNHLSSLMDLAAQAMTGVKPGFSATLEAEAVKILQTTAAACQHVAMERRKKDANGAALPSDEAYLQAHPECRPVIVLQNFLHKTDASSTLLYDKMAEWAAALVRANMAHVIILTSETSYAKSLSPHLPDRVFRQIAMGDLPLDVARDHVLSLLEETRPGDQKADEDGRRPKVHRAELDPCIHTLGGRLNDLELLARRLVATGQTPAQAVAEMVEQSASEILKVFLLNNSKSQTTRLHVSSPSPSTSGDAGASADKAHNTPDQRYTPEQAWILIKQLAEKESLPYHKIFLCPSFATTSPVSPEAALAALADAELITIDSSSSSSSSSTTPTAPGLPHVIRPGKPIYRAAFATLRHDPLLAARMDRAVLAALVHHETVRIAQAETELARLNAGVSGSKFSALATERVEYLLKGLSASQEKIRAWEEEMARLRGVLWAEE